MFGATSENVTQTHNHCFDEEYLECWDKALQGRFKIKNIE